MEYEIIALVLLLILSGFFSSSEIAIVVSNKLKIELRARKNNLLLIFVIKNIGVIFSFE